MSAADLFTLGVICYILHPLWPALCSDLKALKDKRNSNKS